MKQLDPKSEWIFFFQYTIIIFAILSGIASTIFLIISQLTLETASDVLSIILIILTVETVTLFVSTIIGLVMAHYAYKFYKYELREDGFRKEHGVIWKKYVTIPYERIQNVDIYRGILTRLLGLSDLQIQTAGMSSVAGSYGAASEGRLMGVTKDEAERLRDELIRRAHGSKNQGI